MIILMGLAGTGKSTQGRRLAAATGKVWLSAGEVLRETGDAEVQKILDAGNLVPNELIEKLMVERILAATRAGKGVIIDGFPRDVEQAQWLAEKLATAVEIALVIEVPKDELLKRLELRGRSDDKREVILRRFEEFERNDAEICAILARAGVRVEKVDGLGTEDEVAARIREIVG